VVESGFFASEGDEDGGGEVDDCCDGRCAVCDQKADTPCSEDRQYQDSDKQYSMGCLFISFVIDIADKVSLP
jgi:hypothetical protein